MIANRDFRRTLLSLNGLSPAHADDPLPNASGETGTAWLHAMVRRLGFVQVDSISTVERPQYLIPFTRNPRFEHAHLDRLVEQDRKLFEHWTHDAAILPVESWPYWKQFCERERNYELHPGYKRYFSFVTKLEIARVRRRVAKDGPLRPRDIGGRKVEWEGNDQYPMPSAAKVALEYLWRTGELAVSHRSGREKTYDLIERVLPARVLRKTVSRARYLDWICSEALQRLGAATPAQIARFFDAVLTAEAEDWCRRNLGKRVVQVRVGRADRSTSGSLYALASFVEAMGKMPAAPRTVRLLSPFDPLVHDRQRTRRVFGFDYTVEIFVPAKKRKYGYYVLPILEGERFTGRVDVKVDRKKKILNVLGLWWESGVKPTKKRTGQLDRALATLAGFTTGGTVAYKKGYAKG